MLIQLYSAQFSSWHILLSENIQITWLFPGNVILCMYTLVSGGISTHFFSSCILTNVKKQNNITPWKANWYHQIPYNITACCFLTHGMYVSLNLSLLILVCLLLLHEIFFIDFCLPHNPQLFLQFSFITRFSQPNLLLWLVQKSKLSE